MTTDDRKSKMVVTMRGMIGKGGHRRSAFGMALTVFTALAVAGAFGCAAGKKATQVNSDESRAAADSTKKSQVMTRLQGDELRKTMDYPYLTVKFHQNDTEVEMVLDPSATNLNLDLVRNPDGSWEVSKGDSVMSRQGRPVTQDSLSTITKNERAEGMLADLTEEIVRDINLAQQLFYKKQYDEALRVLQGSLQKKRTAAAYALGGSIYFVNGDVKHAVSAWENALEINPNLDEVRALVARYKN